MDTQIVAISSLVISGVSTGISLYCLRMSRKKSSRPTGMDRNREKQASSQRERSAGLVESRTAERLTRAEKTITNESEEFRKSLAALSQEVLGLKRRLEDHSRMVLGLQSASATERVQAKERHEFTDPYELRDETSRLQNTAPTSQELFDSLFPSFKQPLAENKSTNNVASELPLASDESTKSLEPYESVTQQYQEAVNRSDRQALRRMQYRELNISSDSEDSLTRGNITQATRLVAVSGGGSYMIVNSEGRFWLFPTALTLDSFSSAQPQKGIFNYEGALLTRPVVKRPAEVSEDGECWVITTLGVICVPS